LVQLPTVSKLPVPPVQSSVPAKAGRLDTAMVWSENTRLWILVNVSVALPSITKVVPAFCVMT